MMASDLNLVIVVQFDGTGYAYWSHLMQNVLKGQKLRKHISRKIEKSLVKEDSKFEGECEVGKIL